MTIAGEVKTLDEVPEALREHYEQVDGGGYRLAVQGMVPKAKLDEFRTNNINLQRALEKYDDVDLDEIAALRNAIADAERKKAEDSGDWEAREKQLRDEMASVAAKEREKLETRLNTYTSALDDALRKSSAAQAIAEHKGSTKVLMPHVLAHTKIIEHDGKFDVVVTDEQGNVRVGDSGGNNMTIGQYVESLKQDPDFARNFEGTRSSGGGSSKSAGGGHVHRIAADDEAAFLANLEDIASGKVEVAT